MSQKLPKFRLTLLTAGLLLAGCSPPEVHTPLELAEGAVLTSYEDMIGFLNTLEEETGAFTMETIGTSVEGRNMVALHFHGTRGGETEDDGRLKVFIYAQQHGNEPSGKEAAIALTRDIATGAFTDFLESVDFYLVPQVNPDGSEALQRRNAEGLDLNRDHLPLFSPEVAALHTFYNQLLPDVTLDVHEYGFAGSTWVEAGLHKNFGQQIGALSNANMSMALRQYAWDQVIPTMMAELAPKEVFLQRYLVTDGPEARFRFSTTAVNDGRNSMGIYHSLSFLIEGQNGVTVEENIRERTRQQLETIKAFLRFFGARSEEVKAMVAREKEALTGDNVPAEVALVMDYVPDSQRPTLPIGVINLESGRSGTRMVENFHPKVEATLWVERPLGYVVPGALSGVIDALGRHGIETAVVESPTPAVLETYTIAGINPTAKEDKEFLEVQVSSSRAQNTIPAGDLIVWCDQLATNLIVTLLEPQSQWGLAPLPDFLSMLAVGSEYPIKRIVGLPG